MDGGGEIKGRKYERKKEGKWDREEDEGGKRKVRGDINA